MTIVPSGGSNPRAFSLLKQYSRKVTFGFCCTAATCAIFPLGLTLVRTLRLKSNASRVLRAGT
jgi:hypothetical protein